MLLDHELAQPLVDKAIGIIKKNVNIMNSDAIIIASGDPGLIGVFHEGADSVIKYGTPIEVLPEQVGVLKGVVRPGVNLPIAFGGKTIGVVGVSGHPEEIRSSVGLVKVMVELMLEQLVLKRQLDLEKRANESFLNDLLTGNIGDHEDLFLNRAGILGYDLGVSRYAIVINIDRFSEVVEKKFASQSGIRAELALQEVKDKVFSCIKKIVMPDGGGIAIFVGGDEFAILQSGDGAVDETRWRRKADQAIELLKNEIMKQTDLTITVGIGSRYKDFKEYCRSFQEGRNAIKIGQCLDGPGKAYWFEELKLENLLSLIPPAMLRQYADNVFPLLKLGRSEAELIYTLEVLFDNSLNPTQAAKKLFVHRNTVLFRLHKLYKDTGYRPVECFKDAVELKIALLIHRFLNSGRFDG
ncbi:MAG: sugar diacid recognition domain-containing protein [Negativicutes bacterium]|nr:sugar diacid recognition domain-containing protein [Negativicutes bacterium]